MITLIGYHQIDDHEHWLASPKRDELFGPLGVTARTFLGIDDPTHAAVLFDVPDLDAFRDLLESEEIAAAMSYDGVHADTLVILAETQPAS